MEKEGTKYWRGGIIHVTPDGKIDKVLNLDGTAEITGQDEVTDKVKRAVLEFDEEERCIYGENGKCYCT